MDDTVDLLKIKIEKAKANLPAETVNAIAAVNWKDSILGLRDTYGYTLEQLGDLELETELLLCGLVRGEDYPKELANRMRIPKTAANELVNHMNDLVFKKIREELIKNTERKRLFQKSSNIPAPAELPVIKTENEAQVLNSAGIKVTESTLPVRTMDLRKEVLPEKRENILQKIEKLEQVNSVNPILKEKLFGSMQIPTIKTEHSLENITKTAPNVETPKTPTPTPRIDPYREIPE